VQIENRGASCTNCAHYGKTKPGEIYPACRLCSRREGLPGWEPGPGVQVKETRCLLYRAGSYIPVPVLVREVQECGA
jgi:hypothetical protein